MRSAYDSLRADYEERGYLAPVSLFDPKESQALLARLQQERDRPPLDWAKGRAATSPAYFELATHDRLLDLVTTLIGSDVLLWGATLLARRQGQVHRWHTDVESAASTARTVSLWIGLVGTEPRSSLKVVPYSHEFGLTIQQVLHENGATDRQVADEEIERWATERDARSSVTTAEAFDGDAVVFDGRLWHASDNRGERTRYAVLLQYATPATPIRIPNLRPGWPVELYRAPRPPCIVVSGHDAYAVNRLVPGPVPARDGQPLLSSRIHALSLPLERDLETGWKPQGLFRGSTRVADRMGAHASVLEPGKEPHPPHRHEEEELLVVLDGQAELVVEAASDSEQHAIHRIGRGSFAYYPANASHTIRNASEDPITYLMFKWTTGREGQETLGPRVVVPAEAGEAVPHSSPGRSTVGLLDGETKHLRTLGAHLTALDPGAGYEPHVDAYDVAILVLSGTVETLGERVGVNGLIFCAAGEAHGMRNVGEGPASYLVFEFRGTPRAAAGGRRAGSRGAATALRARANAAFARVRKALR